MPSDPLIAEIKPAESLAAIDLGSNSFHMIVARPLEGDPARALPLRR